MIAVCHRLWLFLGCINKGTMAIAMTRVRFSLDKWRVRIALFVDKVT